MSSLRRLRKLLDSYGAQVRHWPPEERAALQALLEASSEAQRLLNDARQLDEALQAARRHESSRLWPAGGEQAALHRVRARVLARGPVPATAGSTQFRALRRWAAQPWPASGSLRWAGAVAVNTVVVVLGVWVGWQHGEPLAQNTVLTTLQFAPIRALGW